MSDTLRIPDAVRLPELTLRGIVVGMLITVVFTASNVYLGLKVGLTFSSAIPAAVISMAVLRLFGNANILENNMVQTQASAAGTLSAVIFVLPALVMMGHWQGFPFLQTMILCAAGGMLGVLFTIPLRHLMVVQSDLPYPEGVAAAEILRVGHERAHDTDGVANPQQASAPGWRDIAVGAVTAGGVSFATGGLRVLGDSASFWVQAAGAVFRFPMGFSLALLGAGWLVGMVAGMATLLGVVLAWGVAVPVLTSVQDALPGETMIAFGQRIWANDVRFMGAGVIAVGAVWTLGTLFMPMMRGIAVSFKALSGAGSGVVMPRTQTDLNGRVVLVLALVLTAVLFALFTAFVMDFPLTGYRVWFLAGFAVLFAVVFGFLVAAACGYMAGLVGSSTSPISGVGIVAVVLVSALMLIVDKGVGLLALHDGSRYAVALAIFVTSAILAVAAIANDNLQDLKTGWLVGATPWRQQVALLIGCVVGAAVISPVLDLLYAAYGFADSLPRPDMDPAQALSAPQATLMLAIARGIFAHDLNWVMLGVGVLLGFGVIGFDLMLGRHRPDLRLPVLAVGIGIYLPPQSSMPIVVGAVLAWLVKRSLDASNASPVQRDHSLRRGVLVASGLIVGESLVGVALAGVIGWSGEAAPLQLVSAGFKVWSEIFGLLTFGVVMAWMAFRMRAR